MNVRPKEIVFENIIFNNVEEVNQVIEKLKTHKAAGPDTIPAELIKEGGIELK
jgi:hypothetical protein